MEQQNNLQNNIIVYTFEVSGLEEEEIITLIEQTPLNIKSTIMDTLNIFEKRGIRVQTEKIVRNLVRSSNLTDEQIASAAEVTGEYVARIRESIKSETSSNR